MKDRYERPRQVAQALHEEAAWHFSRVDADAREEDRACAEARTREPFAGLDAGVFP